MGPEDHAWSGAYSIPAQPLRVPSLQWVSDFSESDLMAYRLAIAIRQPLGRA
jgi:hypothetical protein